MRRSKSDPSKYARNYRKISQRRMTQFDDINEDQEIDRLRKLLRDSEAHLQKHTVEPDEEDNGDDDNAATDDVRPHRRGKKRKAVANGNASQEGGYGQDADDQLIILATKKKKKKQGKKAPVIQLTPQEIKQAKAFQKKTERKLHQLETRRAQKLKRKELYDKLEQHKIVNADVIPLLRSSASLSRKHNMTKKQQLQVLIRKEKMGVQLTEEENDLLYSKKVVDDAEMDAVVDEDEEDDGDDDDDDNDEQVKPSTDASNNDQCASGGNMNATSKKSKKTKKSKSNPAEIDDEDHDATGDMKVNGNGKGEDDTEKDPENEADESAATAAAAEPTPSPMDFAAQMMASLTTLKHKTQEKKEPEVVEPANDLVTIAAAHSGPRYVPTNPTPVITAAAMGLESSAMNHSRRVMEIKRPKEVSDKRYDLPVSTMEFEIIDAIRNNDVTILCGETGSGKSTQVPQFLFEAGFSLCPGDESKFFKIGITQPRRVAAVSTAKRVCYEMGQGDGQSIKSKGSGKKNKNGNLVSYKTRYESAGLGSDNAVCFMTDGVLLQEIQNDLLLRQYSVIVLDEIHERNLNTDVLIGLLSAAISLRKRAAAEDGMVPLKLVLMSATLRVEDFTKNEKLFLNGKPAVVRVPGRTHPVTIHHSKVTELDDYETAAYKKICKIHRKLPTGGVLVFLTGKHEIVRMVNRLRKTFRKSSRNVQSEDTSIYTGDNDVTVDGVDKDSDGTGNPDDRVAIREMDDEEVDAEDITDDYDEMENDEIIGDIESTDDNIPKKALILPMHSMLSAEEQAKVFSEVPDDHRLIVVATNICETSITIPNMSYVVDTGRHKCRNYNSSTGVASYDVMWISRAAADQRAGRAGRTGPGHCYRLYSSSMYARHMDAFEIPEILSRPLEDVVLAMKSLRISDVSAFPFPTPPDPSQLRDAIRLLSRIGCVDTSNVDEDGGDGIVTKLGAAVAKLPLGVRCGKILLVAANAGVLDYAVAMVAVLTESNIFQVPGSQKIKENDVDVDGGNDNANSSDDDASLDEHDAAQVEKMASRKKKTRRWHHPKGDVLAATLAVGACAYAGRGAGGASEHAAIQRFCEDNSLDFVAMTRVLKMRNHLARIAKTRLNWADGTVARTGTVLSKMKPPGKVEELLLAQAIASGSLDHVAIRAPPGSIPGDHPYSLRTAYISCTGSAQEPLFLDRNSVLYARDSRVLPQWICYSDLVRKTLKDGASVSVMKSVTPVEPSWIAALSQGSSLLQVGKPLSSPPPIYDAAQDAVTCAVQSKFGIHGWELPPLRKEMYTVVQANLGSPMEFVIDDSFRWFARYLLEGKVLAELKGFRAYMNGDPGMITRKTPISKVSLLVSSLSSAGVDSAAALRKHWAEVDDKLLLRELKGWILSDEKEAAKSCWRAAVKANVQKWKRERR